MSGSAAPISPTARRVVLGAMAVTRARCAVAGWRSDVLRRVRHPARLRLCVRRRLVGSASTPVTAVRVRRRPPRGSLLGTVRGDRACRHARLDREPSVDRAPLHAVSAVSGSPGVRARARDGRGARRRLCSSLAGALAEELRPPAGSRRRCRLLRAGLLAHRSRAARHGRVLADRRRHRGGDRARSRAAYSASCATRSSRDDPALLRRRRADGSQRRGARGDALLAIALEIHVRATPRESQHLRRGRSTAFAAGGIASARVRGHSARRSGSVRDRAQPRVQRR